MSRRATTSATVWLESIELENVRCFRERQTIPFTTRDGKKAQWTLLLGENGTGKSTLLQVCAMLMPRKWEFNHDIDAYLAHSHFRTDESGRTFDLLRTDKSMDPARLAISLRIDGQLTSWAWRIRAPGAARSVAPDSSTPRFKAAPKELLCLAYAPYRSSWEFMPEGTEADQVRGLFIGFTRLRHPGEWYKERTYATVNPSSDEKSKKNAKLILDQVKKTLIKLLPNVDELEIRTEREGRGANRLFAKTPDGWVAIDQLGLGYQSVLSLVVDIASRLVEHYPDSPNPLAEPAVILIDEVDLHLHPKWQRILQKELSEQFPNAQFIATAHSPLVVQSSPEANILLLKREGDHVVVQPAFDEIKNWRVDQILTSDLFGLPTSRPPHLDKLIQERNEILGKPTLSAKDEKRLEQLRAKIETIPGGETRWEMDAMELIRKAARKLEASEVPVTTHSAKKKKAKGRA